MKHMKLAAALAACFVIGLAFVALSAEPVAAGQDPCDGNCYWYGCMGIAHCCPDPQQGCSLMDYYVFAPWYPAPYPCTPTPNYCRATYIGCLSTAQCAE